jgi:hypothetical protein
MRIDNRPLYEPAPERHQRGDMLPGIAALAAIMALAWIAAVALHWIGVLL